MSDQPEEQEKAPSKPPIILRDKFRFAVIAIVLIYVFSGIIGQKLKPYLSEKTQDKTVEKTIEKEAEKSPVQTIEKQTEQTEKQTEKSVEEVPPSPIAITEPSSQNDERIHALEEKISLLETAHENSISELKSKLETQNSNAQSKIDNVLSSLIVFGQLKDSVNNGESYSTLLNQLKKLIENNPQTKDIITALENNSEGGIITPAQLKTKFTPLIKQALDNKNENAFLNILHKFIAIRKVGEQAGDSDEAILARTEIKLTKNDLSGALKELMQLSPPAQEIFTSWITTAQNWLDTHENMDKLQLLLTASEPAPQP